MSTAPLIMLISKPSQQELRKYERWQTWSEYRETFSYKLLFILRPELQRYNIKGVAAFAKEMEEKGLGKPKVSLQFELSTSGITELVKAEAAVEETYTVEEEVEVEDDEASGDNTTAESEGGDNTERKTEETAEAEKSGNDTEADSEKKEAKKEKKTKLITKVRMIVGANSCSFLRINTHRLDIRISPKKSCVCFSCTGKETGPQKDFGS